MMMNTMPGKRSSADMQGAFEGMHASEDMYEKVMARASHRGRRRGGAPRIAAVVAIVLAVALAAGGTAYAVLGGEFFFRGWGSHGRSQVNTWTVDGVDGEYSRTFGAVGEDELSEELKASVEYAGRAVEAHGYTLLVENVLVDDLGCGAATFTVSNPDGIKINPAYGVPGDMVFDDDSDLRLLHAEYGDGSNAHVEVVYDLEASTKTEIRGTIYFDAFQRADAISSGIKWMLVFNDEDVATDAFVPSKVAASREFKTADGIRAKVSPIALVFDDASARETYDGLYEGEPVGIDKLSVTMDSGENLVVTDEDARVYNIFGSCLRTDDDGVALETVYRPTQLLAPEKIAAVSASGSLHYEDGQSPAWQAEYLPVS